MLGPGISQIFLGNIQFPGNGIRERRPLEKTINVSHKQKCKLQFAYIENDPPPKKKLFLYLSDTQAQLRGIYKY